MIHSESNKELIDFDSIVHELHCEARDCHQPVNGTFELTERCNLNCQMCFIRQSAGNIQQRRKELTINEWLKLTHQAVDNGMIFLLLTGGEIFLRSDFFEFYKPITQLGLFITLFSNGTLITDLISAKLEDYPPHRISVTLYGASANTYKIVTGDQENFYRCCMGIEALLKHNISLDLKATITKQNVHEIKDLRKLAHKWGLPISFGYQLSKRRDREFSKVSECRLSASECIEIERIDVNTEATWAKEVIRKRSLIKECNFDCNAGRAAFTIGSSGLMNVCLDLPFPSVHPLEIGFKNAWKHLQNFIESSPPLSQECIDCDARPFCSRCPAWSYLEAGSISEPVPYLCEIAHERKLKYNF